MSFHGIIVILTDKNTMMRKGPLERNSALQKLLTHIRDNVGFIFTPGDIVKILENLLENKVNAPASLCAIAPLSVIILV